MSPSLLTLVKKITDAPSRSLDEDDVTLVQAALVAEQSTTALPIWLMTASSVLALWPTATRLPTTPSRELLVVIDHLTNKDVTKGQLLLAYLTLKAKREAWESFTLQAWLSSTQGFVPELNSLSLSPRQKSIIEDPSSWSS